MKRILVSVFLFAMIMCSINMSVSAEADIHGHWAKDIIEELSSKKIIRGYEDGSFKPDNSISRAEFISILNRAMNFKGSAEVFFKDVKKSDWFYNDLQILIAKGIVTGYSDGTFLPNENLTRAEAATILARVIGNSDVEKIDNEFLDDKEIPIWAKSNVFSVVKSKIMSGYPDNSFRANNKITRAEAFVIVDRLMKNHQDSNSNSDDLYVGEDKSVISGKKVKGNLVVTDKLAEGTITLKDTVVDGNLIVLGGGSHSVNVNNVQVRGEVVLKKEGVRFNLVRKNQINTIVIEEPALIDSENFSGKIDKIEVSHDDESKKISVISVRTKDLVLTEKSYVRIQKNVDNLLVEKTAKDSTVELSKNAVISNLASKDSLQVRGDGRVEKIETGSKNVKIEGTIKQGKENKDSSSSSGSNNYKSVKSISLKPMNENITSDNGVLNLKVEYKPEDADNKDFNFNVVVGANIVKVEKVSTDTLRLTALDNGDVEINFFVSGNPYIKTTFNGKISNQIVGITGDVSSLTPGDKTVKGIVANKFYILEVDGKFAPVNSDGSISSVMYGSLEEAKFLSNPINNGVTEITGLENKKIYRVYDVKEEDLLSLKLEKYLKLSENDVNKDNVFEIKTLEDYLKAKIAKKIKDFDSDLAKKKEWEQKKVKFEEKQEQLKNKIKDLSDKVWEALNEINSKIDEINNQLSFGEIKTKVSEIDNLFMQVPKNKYSEITQERINKLAKVKEEITAYESYENILKQPFTMDSKGVVTIPSNLNPEFTIYAKFKSNNHHLNDTIRQIGPYVKFNFFNQIRKSGVDDAYVGDYCAELSYDRFQYLPKFLKESNSQKLEHLKLIESVTLDENLAKKAGGNNNIVEIDLNRGVLKWDSVENAEYYEIYATITDLTTEKTMGKYYLPDVKKFEKINDMTSFKELPREKGKHGYSWPIVERGEFINAQAVRVATKLPNKNGIKANEISLSEFIPTAKGNVDSIDQIIDAGNNNTVDIDIYIIPINYSGLYITDKNLIQTNKTIFIQGIKFKDFLEKFRIQKN